MSKTRKDGIKYRNPVTYEMIQRKRNARHTDKRKAAMEREHQREADGFVTVNKEESNDE